MFSLIVLSFGIAKLVQRNPDLYAFFKKILKSKKRKIDLSKNGLKIFADFDQEVYLLLKEKNINFKLWKLE